MNGLLAKPVFEVLKHGFWIYELVQKGEDISFQLERTILADMVKAIPDPVYEKQNSSIYTKQINLKNENDRRERNQGSNGFMGARYPIVCFLDSGFFSHDLQNRSVPFTGFLHEKHFLISSFPSFFRMA